MAPFCPQKNVKNPLSLTEADIINYKKFKFFLCKERFTRPFVPFFWGSSWQLLRLYIYVYFLPKMLRIFNGNVLSNENKIFK